MRIVVAYKWAANPHDAMVGASGLVDCRRLVGEPCQARLSESDPVACELARRLEWSTSIDVLFVPNHRRGCRQRAMSTREQR